MDEYFKSKGVDNRQYCCDYETSMFKPGTNMSLPWCLNSLNKEHPDNNAISFIDFEVNDEFAQESCELDMEINSLNSAMLRAWRRFTIVVLLSLNRYKNSPNAVVLPLELQQYLVGVVIASKTPYNPTQTPRILTRNLVRAFPYFFERRNIDFYTDRMPLILNEYKQNLSTDPMLTFLLYTIQEACANDLCGLKYNKIDMVMAYLEERHSSEGYPPLRNYERKMPLVAVLSFSAIRYRDVEEDPGKTPFLTELIIRCLKSPFFLCSDTALYCICNPCFFIYRGHRMFDLHLVWDTIIHKAHFARDEPSTFKKLTRN
jgi:hypothetical protein